MNNLDTGIVGHPDNILLFAEPPEYTMNMKILENMYARRGGSYEEVRFSSSAASCAYSSMAQPWSIASTMGRGLLPTAAKGSTWPVLLIVRPR